jgi:hypothetical protein
MQRIIQLNMCSTPATLQCILLHISLGNKIQNNLGGGGESESYHSGSYLVSKRTFLEVRLVQNVETLAKILLFDTATPFH